MKWLIITPMLLVALSVGQVRGEEIVYFEDANLEAAVEAELGIDDPNAAEMLLLTFLAASSSEIFDLTGLEYATNLTELYLGGNPIGNISALGGLGQLSVLSLWNIQVSDIAPLAGLTNLTELYLNNNQISDISALQGLSNLVRLDLGLNQISDISALLGGVVLTDLYLDRNQINDISALKDSGQLERLYLHYNQLNSMAYCTYLPVIEINNPGVDLIYDSDSNPLTNDCSTDLADLQEFFSHWLEPGCDVSNNWCGGADLNHLDDVDIGDFAVLAGYWLAD
jgi:Leucine-rich repeat (LRR) protein